MRGWAKVSYFFFPGIVYRHSLTRFSKILFFFSTFCKKKKYKLLFFFSQEKFTSHSLAWGADIYKKRTKTRVFCNFFTFRLFFFPNIFSTCYVFFFQEKFNLHSLTRFFGPEKKNSSGKKKHNFHSLTRFLPKKCKN